MNNEMLRDLTYDGFLEHIKTNNLNNYFLLDLCRYNQSEHLIGILKYIFDNDIIDVTITDIYGDNFLHNLCACNRSEHLLGILKYIVDNRVIDVTITNNNGNNFLHILCIYKISEDTTNIVRNNLLEILK